MKRSDSRGEMQANASVFVIQTLEEAIDVNLMSLKLIAAFLGMATLASAQSVPANPRPTAQQTFSRTASMGPYHPISGVGRLKWFLNCTVGPQTLVVGLFSAGIGTARNAPKEYGGSFEGFAKRYGMR